jgi:hypothetical protein
MCKGRGSTPSRSYNFPFAASSRQSLWPIPGITRLERETDHSPPCNAEVTRCATVRTSTAQLNSARVGPRFSGRWNNSSSCTAEGDLASSRSAANRCLDQQEANRLGVSPTLSTTWNTTVGVFVVPRRCTEISGELRAPALLTSGERFTDDPYTRWEDLGFGVSLRPSS